MNLDAILPLVKKPSRYLGRELNMTRKDWEAVDLRIALIFPDLYEIGMSHQGLQILYHIVNSRPEYLAERAYAPGVDMERQLRRHGSCLFSLESHRPLAEFDILGITLPYELCYVNILTILDLSGIPFRSRERDESYPLIIGGGPCAFHPEPVADFFDAILLGDGEEAILELADIVKDAKHSACDKQTLLTRLTRVEGVYVPGFFKPGTVFGGSRTMEPLRAGYERVRRRILPDLEKSGPDSPPLVPLTKIVHDRLGIEIARGCTRGCRFCQAGIIYRPVRERSPARIMELAEAGIRQGGFDELSLLSLSSGDYSCLAGLLGRLMDTFVQQRVSVSMPSMRVGTLTPDIMTQILRVRKTGFTLAPEAGTDRLRQVINKGITEQDLLAACDSAFRLGWKLLKMYFMLGLPTETEADLEAIGDLVRKALHSSGRSGCRINVSVATFVPKPHTVFQWAPQLSVEEGFARMDTVRKYLPRKGVNLKWHDPRQSFLEGVFSRGDRRLSPVIEEAWRNGARFDAWSESFSLPVWLTAAETCNVALADYLRERGLSDPLPWRHLDVGVDEKFLKEELVKAGEGIYTPDCRKHGCRQCGVCDFKNIKPVTHEKFNMAEGWTSDTPQAVIPQKAGDRQNHFVYKINYSRLDEARFLGHLEVIQIFFRAFRRAGLPLNFSQGYNPVPKVSFSPALPLGTESMAEYLLVDLREPPGPGLVKQLNRELPPGFKIQDIQIGCKARARGTETCYRIDLPRRPADKALDPFRQSKSFPVTLKRGGKKRQVDAKVLIKDLSLLDTGIVQIILANEPDKPGAKPMELLAAVLDLGGEEAALARVLKVWTREFDETAASV